MNAVKKILICIVCIALVVISTFVGQKNNISVNSKAIINAPPKIIIDAGHGGFDGGAVAKDGTVEKDINLDIALMLGDMLSLSGMNVIYTRTDDTGTDTVDSDEIRTKKKNDLQNRLKLMKENPDCIYVSIHLNKFTTSSANGAQVFYSPGQESAMQLAQSIQNRIVSYIQPDNTRVIKKGTKDTYLLYNAYVPAVIVECGFLSNIKELQALKNPEYQAKIAFCIFTGIYDYFIEE